MKAKYILSAAGLFVAGFSNAAEPVMVQNFEIVTAAGGTPNAMSTVSVRASGGSDGTARFNYADEAGGVDIVNDVAGNKSVVVKAAGGAVTYAGPYTTEADRLAAPAEVRDRIASVEGRIAMRRTEGAGGGGGGGGGAGMGPTRVTIERSATASVSGESSANSVFKDPEGTVEMNTRNGSRIVTVKAPDGAVIFSGPLNTDEERAALPAEIRDRIQKKESAPVRVRVSAQ